MVYVFVGRKRYIVTIRGNNLKNVIFLLYLGGSRKNYKNSTHEDETFALIIN